MEQVTREREERKTDDEDAPQSDEKIAGNGEKGFAKHLENPCRREVLVARLAPAVVNSVKSSREMTLSPQEGPEARRCCYSFAVPCALHVELPSA